MMAKPTASIVQMRLKQFAQSFVVPSTASDALMVHVLTQQKSAMEERIVLTGPMNFHRTVVKKKRILLSAAREKFASELARF